MGTHTNTEAVTLTWDHETSLRVVASSFQQVDSASTAVVSQGQMAEKLAEVMQMLLADVQMGLTQVETRSHCFLPLPFCARAKPQDIAVYLSNYSWIILYCFCFLLFLKYSQNNFCRPRCLPTLCYLLMKSISFYQSDLVQPVYLDIHSNLSENTCINGLWLISTYRIKLRNLKVYG